ncbi:MAG: penicillin acylase family protein, partial [Ferruginibacter sp.]
MKQLLTILIFFSLSCKESPNDPAIKRYEAQAARVTIIRDNWGVPHVYGKTDADAVFGLMYAQCEESFERLERNYVQQFGRMAELYGANYLAEDLKMRLVYDTSAAKIDYKNSPAWLKNLCIAFADGINYYLYKHPETKPFVLTHFEPWFAMMLPDGAYIATRFGGLEIEDVNNLYKLNDEKTARLNNILKWPGEEMMGSNGFAIGPSKTAAHSTLLYINPHVSFDFRMEAHIVSEEGLNAYGAVTWGQFFVFQGFNDHCGWMHTSSMADAEDLYEEKITQNGNEFFYEYDGQLKPVGRKQYTLKYKMGSAMKTHAVTTYYTGHGPVMGSRKSKWLSLKIQEHSANGLVQSWQRTKAKNFAEFKGSMQLLSNTSTNTLYADDKGNIAYWHGNFIPKRNVKYNWTLPVDGATSATEWQGTHGLDEIVQLSNPASGWIQNCNSTPFTASGINAPDKNLYPLYMAPEGENFRSLYAIQMLGAENNFNLDKLIAFGNSHYLSAFDTLLPPLLQDLANLSTSDPAYALLKEPAALLKAWDKRSSVSSVATTLAIFWGHSLLSNYYTPGTAEEGSDQVKIFSSIIKNTTPQKRIALLSQLTAGLNRAFGTWKVAWGELNRYQRISGDPSPHFDDNKPSLPVAAASALFGSLPAYETDWTNTKKGYGVAGNSFVAAVEFGEKIRARSIIPGGQSFNPNSKHFADQAQMYLEGKFKDVL